MPGLTICESCDRNPCVCSRSARVPLILWCGSVFTLVFTLVLLAVLRAKG